jgi:chemotaxis protein methyltransferase CheR
VAINPNDFDYIAKVVYDNSAIVLNRGKEYLVESRIAPLAAQHGFDSIAAFVASLRATPYSAIHKDIIEAMTTNETSFFRDIHPFDAIRKDVLPGLIEARRATRKIHIWSGACSSGQEPYSLAMLIREHFPTLNNWNVSITASDISDDILTKARSGCYGSLEINRGLPTIFMMKYFDKKGIDWQVKKPVQDMIRFRQMNLIGKWPMMPKADIIMLRNVMIYFDRESKQSILNQIKRVLQPDGYLFLGSAETTFNLDESFERKMFGRAVSFRLKKT